MICSINFYGDSLTDNGNVCRVLGEHLLYSEILSAKLNITHTSNYARCGATSDDLNLQVAQYKNLSSSVINDIEIHSIFIGGNDFLGRNPWDITDNIYDAIQTIKNASQAIQSYFLLFNLPGFSNVPVVKQFITDKCSLQITPSKLTCFVENACKIVAFSAIDFVSTYHEWKITALSNRLQHEGVNVSVLNIKNFYNDVISNRVSLGFNEDIACEVSQGCHNGLFYDDRHPSFKVHQLISDWLVSEITNLRIFQRPIIEEPLGQVLEADEL